ncbi:hypothetical protein LP421_25900 [Rhizobium sp. RCAM05350]|nr:hypothetical protein LP421_25900 [Rhizobium sp. RCAM05350]
MSFSFVDKIMNDCSLIIGVKNKDAIGPRWPPESVEAGALVGTGLGGIAGDEFEDHFGQGFDNAADESDRLMAEHAGGKTLVEHRFHVVKASTPALRVASVILSETASWRIALRFAGLIAPQSTERSHKCRQRSLTLASAG